jgi:hypothetical protein
MRKFARHAPRHLGTALAVAGLSQFFITCGGVSIPYESDLYGAPVPVGQSIPDLLYGSTPTLFIPFVVLNIVLTATVLLVAATVLNGTMRAGLLWSSAAVAAAYGWVIVSVLVLHTSSEVRANQLVIWLWTLLVVSAAWWVKRSRSMLVEENSAPI